MIERKKKEMQEWPSKLWTVVKTKNQTSQILFLKGRNLKNKQTLSLSKDFQSITHNFFAATTSERGMWTHVVNNKKEKKKFVTLYIKISPPPTHPPPRCVPSNTVGHSVT